ncbi:MAG: hypothetical protein RL318_574 [Fibrobacterota bacterium]|jgi:tetratricopeptide (TPR) repeat protein
MSKPSAKKNQKKKDRAKKVQAAKNRPEPGIGAKPRHDPYLEERALRQVFRERKDEPFADPAELTTLLLLAKAAPAPMDSLDPVEQAQELAFQGLAWLADNHRKAPEKATPFFRRALDLDPDCADAHVGLLYLAGLDHGSSLAPAAARIHLETLLANSRRRLGLPESGEAPEELPPEVLLRPHLRLLDAAILQAEECELLELCPQWSREILRLDDECEQADATRVLTWLLFGNFQEEAAHLFDQFQLEDPTLFWWRSWSAFLSQDFESAKAWREKALTVRPESQHLVCMEFEPESEEEVEEDFLLVHEPLMLALQHEANYIHWLHTLDAA